MKFWRKSLMAQLVSYFLLLSLITGGLGVFVAYVQGKAALEKSIFDRLMAAATLKEKELSRWVEDQQQVVVSIAHLPQIQTQAALLLNHHNTGTQVDSAVYDVAFSPSQPNWLASGGVDQTMRLWDVTTGKQIWLAPHSEGVNGVLFSPKGKTVATVSYDFTVSVFETATGKELARAVHEEDITDLAFSPDGRRLATGTINGAVLIWEIGPEPRVTHLTDELGYVNGVAFSPNGRWLATVSDDGTARLWDLAAGRQVTQVEHEGWVLALTFSPDGRWVSSGDENGLVLVWDTATGREVARLVHDNWITHLTFSPDGRLLATGSDDHFVRLWDLTTGQLMAELDHETMIQNILFGPEGQRLLVHPADTKQILVWDLSTREVITTLEHEAIVSSVDLGANGKWAATASLDGHARVWDISTGKELVRMAHESLPYTLLLRSLATLTASKPDLQELSVLDQSGHVIVSTRKGRLGSNLAEAEYFVQGRDDTFIQDIYFSPATGKPTITIATPFKDRAGRSVGVLTANLNLSRMDAILRERTGLGQTGTTYLVNRNTQSVTSEGFGGRNPHSSGIQLATQGQDGFGRYDNEEGVPVVGVYRWLDEMELALLAEMSQREAAAQARHLALVVSLTGLAAAGLLTVGVVLLARQIARPILTVTNAAASVEAETFELNPLEDVSQRPDEVGLLARVFHHMAREVYIREQRLKQQVKKLRIEIDEMKKAEQVSEIVDTDFFKDLQTKAKAMRRRRNAPNPAERNVLDT
jgi:WD40 repeat protein